MRSKDSADLLDLDIPTSEEESAALWRARTERPLTDEQYFRFVTYWSKHDPARREIPEFHEPFVL